MERTIGSRIAGVAGSQAGQDALSFSGDSRFQIDMRNTLKG